MADEKSPLQTWQGRTESFETAKGIVPSAASGLLRKVLHELVVEWRSLGSLATGQMSHSPVQVASQFNNSRTG